MRHWPDLVLIAALLATLLAAFIPRPVLAKELSPPLTLQLKWHHQFQFAGYYAALEKGFYAEEGLDVRIVPGGPTIDPADQVTSGRADYGVLASELLVKRAAGAPLVCVAPIFQHSIRVLFVHEDSTIRSPQDLAFRRIAINQTESAEILAMMLNEGLPPGDMDFRNKSEDSLALFMRRELDGFVGSIGNEAWPLIQSGHLTRLIRPIDYGIDFYGDCLFTTEREVKEYPKRVEAFRRASIRGWEYAFDHPEEMSELIITKYNPQKTREALLFEAGRLREITQPKLVEIGHSNEGRWKNIANTYRRLGLVAGDFTIDGFFLSYYLEPPLPSRIKGLIVGTGALLLLALIVAGALALFNTRLKRGVERRTAELAAANTQLAREVRMHEEARSELTSLRNMLESVINAMPSILIGVDENGKITHWNQKASEQTGLTQEAAERMNLQEALPALADSDVLIRRALESGDPIRIHKLQLNMTGTTGWYDLTVYPLPHQIGANAVIRIDDVGDLMRMEQTLVQAEKMMSLNSLAAGIAHEINNPLGAIVQGTQNISRRFSPDFPANVTAAQEAGVSLDGIHTYMEKRKIDRLLDGIRESGLRAATIIQNMLDFSRKSDAGMAIVNVHEVLDHAVSLASTDYDLKKKYDFRNISIERRYADNMPPLRIARTEIEQVVLNLLRNSAQAMSSHGSNGETPRIVIETELASRYGRITITDNGPGMDDKTRSRIFEPFFTTKPPGEGTGLGLSVSYSIITRNHAGRFEVESTPGKGTTFILSLPIPTEDGPSAS
ncbi:PAS domain S-box-containing protein [Desulfobaculum xiamenense]|uniref:histidine kinase n=1 Tax=Desulfobaculum xiamenense TaxID=995050 RepID=A0A846QNU5_9BACT|nr:PAS domain S-box-containing protein [Desulfobaculum xiamenense]